MTRKGRERKLSGIMEMLSVLIEMWMTQVYGFFRAHRIVYIIFVYLLVFKIIFRMEQKINIKKIKIYRKLKIKKLKGGKKGTLFGFYYIVNNTRILHRYG